MDSIQLKLAQAEVFPGCTASMPVMGTVRSQGLPEHTNNFIFILLYCFLHLQLLIAILSMQLIKSLALGLSSMICSSSSSSSAFLALLQGN